MKTATLFSRFLQFIDEKYKVPLTKHLIRADFLLSDSNQSGY
ncbi:Uncharacterised protein [Bergeyella zoohelcum]|uniref:Uncharacterized protein n=1 Tax=Bergeyella zoohelcum TaxID=1015 RepID=A0A7Z9CF95_9FLAO|nr:Uncharacterised protein [Bergeyella zoohelcum]